MRIAMFTNNYRPFIGGVPISIERLSQELRKLGHAVYIFAPAYPGKRYERSEKYIVKCKLLKYYRTKAFDFPLVNIFNKEIENIFSYLDLDLVHVHHPFWMGKLGQDLARKYRLPLVFTYHTRFEKMLHNVPVYHAIDNLLDRKAPDNAENGEGFKEMLGKEWVDRRIKKFSNRCDRVFVPTEMMRHHLLDIGVTKPVMVLPTGIGDNYFIFNREKVNQFRNQYIKDRTWLFCTVSRLTKEKNIGFIIRGLAYFKQKISADFTCMIIGDGPQKEELQAWVKKLSLEDHIVFINRVPNQMIGDYYRAADVFLFASKAETQGIVLLEAMAAKVPVVAVEATGVADLVENGKNGYMAKDNAKDWAGRLNRMISDRNSLSDFKEHAYRTALNYKGDVIAEKAEKIYRELLRSKEKTNREEAAYLKYYGR